MSPIFQRVALSCRNSAILNNLYYSNLYMCKYKHEMHEACKEHGFLTLLNGST